MDSGLHEDVERNNAKSKSTLTPPPLVSEKVIKARDTQTDGIECARENWPNTDNELNCRYRLGDLERNIQGQYK